MSKRELTGLPVADDVHTTMLAMLPQNIQNTNDEALGGSQIWFTLGDAVYKASFEKCTGPLKDLSGKNKVLPA